MRLLFRILLAVTLIVLFVGRVSGGKLFPTFFIVPFLAWFSVSVFVFGVFGLRSAYLAFRDPPTAGLICSTSCWPPRGFLTGT